MRRAHANAREHGDPNPPHADVLQREPLKEAHDHTAHRARDHVARLREEREREPEAVPDPSGEVHAEERRALRHHEGGDDHRGRPDEEPRGIHAGGL